MQIDSPALTELLQQNGHLDQAEIVDVLFTPKKTIGLGSEFYTVDLRFSSDNHRCPQRMLLKRSLINDRGQSEADFYELAKRQPKSPAIQCFGVLDEDPGEPLGMLFEDLSDSHFQTEWPLVPSLTHCEQAASVLADLHAGWWGKADQLTVPALGLPFQKMDYLQQQFGGFVDFVGGALSPLRVNQYEMVLADLATLKEQRLMSGAKTLVHTDPHYWNFLYPRNSSESSCQVFDFPLWGTGLGACDLAYMIALHLYPDHRRRFEPHMLDAYRQSLLDQGVNYSREDLDLDYRVGVLNGLMMPIMEFGWKIPPDDWLPKLEKVFGAFDDLDCLSLLNNRG